MVRPAYVASLALLMMAAAPALASPADEAAIRDHGRQWVKAFKAGDVDALMKLYTPDAEVALHGKPKLKGIDAIRGYFTPLLTTPPDADFLLAEESLLVDGDLGVFMSKYWFTVRTPKGEIRDPGRSLIVYRRGADGVWRIRMDIDQAAPDVAYPPPPEAK
jgi:uncharacterized protein (TIGR02246 family)